MTTKRDLLLAILAMDSYNRGYSRGLKFSASEAGGDRSEADVELGRAKIIQDANDPEGIAQAASFYGIAYDMSGVEGFGWGETVIAYRGTDHTEFGGFLGNLLLSQPIDSAL